MPQSNAGHWKIIEELRAQLFESPQPLAIALGVGQSGPFVQLMATGEALARVLYERYGESLEITVGALPYPPRKAIHSPTRPESTVAVDGLELRLVLDQDSVATGDNATGHINLRNSREVLLEIETGEPMVGMTLDRNGNVVGVYIGAIAGVGRTLRLEPGEESAVGAIIGTASCSSTVGYLLQAGEYQALVPLEVYGDLRRPSKQFEIIVPAPARMVLC